MRGKLHSRGEQRRADYILYYRSNIPLAVIEAKENGHGVGAAMQQVLNYAETLGWSISGQDLAKRVVGRNKKGLADG